jgi:uncharacterized protein YecE (DUF72 family)
MSVRIGTSGWVYNHWRGVWYPRDLPQGRWLAFHARRFDTVEVNNSFYRLPSAAAFHAWREQAPPGFVYAVKASRFLTHLKKLKDPEEPLERILTRARHLGSALGPILYQLPPKWTVDLPRLEHFLAILPSEYTHVVEFRDASWLIEDVFRLLERHHVAHCVHDMYPLKVPIRVTAPTAYVRLHGDAIHGGDYTLATLKAWARRIEAWRNERLQVFVYFNNDFNGYAVSNALTLRRLVGAGSVDVQLGRSA